jgi:hypothetical protein
MHTHQHEATQKHVGAFLHFHLRSASPVSLSPEVRALDPDEDALYEGWFSTPPTDFGSLIPLIHVEPFALPLPELGGWPLETPLRVGHDPPLLCRKSPSGPPA